MIPNILCLSNKLMINVNIPNCLDVKKQNVLYHITVPGLVYSTLCLLYWILRKCKDFIQLNVLQDKIVPSLVYSVLYPLYFVLY